MAGTSQTEITAFVRESDHINENSMSGSNGLNRVAKIRKSNEQQLTLASEPKIRSSKTKSTKEHEAGKSLLGKKRTRNGDDVPDTEPGEVPTESQDEQNDSPRKIHCSENLLSKEELQDEKKGKKSGIKHQRSDDDDDEEFNLSSCPVKKSKRIGQFFENLGKEMNSVFKDISSNTKQILRNPNELTNEISGYMGEISKDLVDAAAVTEEYILKGIKI